MKNSHLIAILRTCTKKELRDFRKWLLSPIHNQREDILQLFDYLVSGDHLEKEKFQDKKRIFNKLFPKEAYNDAKIRQVIFFLLKALEEFLIFKELTENQIRSKMALASMYRKRNLDRAFQKTIKSLDDLQLNHAFRNEEYFQNEYLIQQEKYNFNEGKKRIAEMNLQELSDAQDANFIVNKLRQSCEMISHQTVYKTGYKIGLLEEVLAFAETKNHLNLPAIAIYYYGYKAMTEKDNAHHFEHLKTQISENGHLFPKHEIRNIYLMAINYCIRMANTGGETYIREAFELFRLGFEKMVLIDNNMVSPFTFRNAITAALKLKEFKWVETFIHKYKENLHPKYRKNFFLHSLARLHFERKDYKTAMQLLIQADFDDILINLNAKTMLMKMYYELDEIDALDSLLESMRTYVQRKEVIGYHKSNYQNIIRLTKKLSRLSPYNGKQKTELITEINTSKPLTEKSWLLEKIEAF